MPLGQVQRAWLDQALNSKGRFVRKATIRKEYENYARRRDKTAAAWAGLPSNHPDVAAIERGVAAADEDAKIGNFSSAYKTLSAIKDLAKAAVAGRSEGLHDANIRMMLKTVESHINATVLEVEACAKKERDLTNRCGALRHCSEADTFDAALKILGQLDGLTPVLRGDVASAVNDFHQASGNLVARGIDGAISRLETDLAALRATGRDAIADKYSGGLETLKKTYNGSGGQYKDATALHQRGDQLNLHAERAIFAARSLKKFDQSQTESVREDAKTTEIRSGLKPLPEAAAQQLALRESERRDALIQDYYRQRNQDSFNLLDKSTMPLNVAPEPEKYNFDTVFAGMMPAQAPIPDEVPQDLKTRLITESVSKITDGLTDDDASDDVLLNMSVRCASELEKMALEQLFPGKQFRDLTDSQKDLCSGLGAAMETEICRLSPNKMADDASEITIGGTKYVMVKELKSGANGTARLFRDPNPPNEIVVVKSMMDPGRRADMAYEIETHYRATQGEPDEDSGIVDFKGAARSDDGGLHMVLEAVDGGDLEDMNGAMGAMESLGLLPPDAKRAIAVENLRKVVEAMKKMEAQGLVHHDLKPENVMFTSDGKVKIIDFGESTFVEEDGVARPDSPLADTPGYRAPEAYDPTFTSKFDTYALAGFLQKLVGGVTPEGHEIKMEADTALGRLISALRNKDPEKRPSLDAVLATTIMNSAQEDHGQEALDNLTAASTEFADLASGLKLTISLSDLEDGISPQNAAFFRGEPPKLSKAQAVMSFIDQDISNMIERNSADKDYALSDGNAQLKQLLEQKKFLQTHVIDKMIKDQLEAGEREYDDALMSDEASVTFDLGQGLKSVTPKGAATLVEQYLSTIENLRRQAFTLIEDPVKSAKDVQAELDVINQKLSDLDIYVKRVEAALKDALGPAAKLFLAKKKLNEATVNFQGGTRAEQEVDDRPDEIDEDPFDGLSLDKQVGQLFETGDNKEDLADEIDREATP